MVRVWGVFRLIWGEGRCGREVQSCLVCSAPRVLSTTPIVAQLPSIKL